MDPLAIEITRLRAELARTEEERQSSDRIATAALHALKQSIHEPVGFWIRESEEQKVIDLLEASKVERMLASEGTRRRSTIQAKPQYEPPSFDTPIVPLRVAVPAEVFDHIASFVDHATLSVLSRVDFAWLQRFHPLGDRSRVKIFDLGPEDRARLVSLLTRGGNNYPTSIPRVESILSLRNLTQLAVASLLIQDDAFPELSRDNLGLGGTPLQIKRLTIFLAVRRHIEGNQPQPGIRPSVHFLSLVDPINVSFQRSHRPFNEPLGHSNAQPIHSAWRQTYHITRAGAVAIRHWSRLRVVQMYSLDVHTTDDDIPSRVPGRHVCFLGESSASALVHPKPYVEVWWDLQRRHKDEYVWTVYPPALVEPVEYLAARRSLEGSIVKKASLIIRDEAERATAEKTAAKPAHDLGMIKIVADYDVRAK